MKIATIGVSHVLQTISALCLKSLKYKCICRFHDYNPVSLSPLMPEGPLLSFVEKGALQKLTLDPQYLPPEGLVLCLRLTVNQVSHLVLNSAYHFVNTIEEDLPPKDLFDLNLLTIHDKCKSQNNLPLKFEVSQVNNICRFTDEGILV